MKTINIENNRILTIELTSTEHYCLWDTFSTYAALSKSTYLRDMINILSMTNGNTLNREITINNLVASVIESEISEMKSRFRRDKKEYGGDLMTSTKRDAVNKFLKAIKTLNK